MAHTDRQSHALIRSERNKSGTFQRSTRNEDIFASIVRCDKPEPSLRTEEFDFTFDSLIPLCASGRVFRVFGHRCYAVNGSDLRAPPAFRQVADN